MNTGRAEDTTAAQALRRIAGLYAVEKDIRGKPTHCLADRLRIDRIVFVSLYVRLDELRGHQSHGVTHRLQLARPVMSAAAGFDPDQADRKVGEKTELPERA